MARSINGGWDFLEVGNQYQYKEEGWIAMVTVLENHSDKDKYEFLVRVEKSTTNLGFENDTFTVMSKKELPGIWPGMSQFYEHEAYLCNYKYVRSCKKS